MKSSWRVVSSLAVLVMVVAFAWVLGNGSVASAGTELQGGQEMELSVIEALGPGVSRAVRELPRAQQQPVDLVREINPRQNKSSFLQGNVTLEQSGPDALLARQATNAGRTPAPSLNIEGMDISEGCGSCAPPDTVGEVGPNHYIQMVNSAFSIYNKSGTRLAGPTNINALFTNAVATPRCNATNSGDPIVLYDQQADRWLLSQFVSSSPYALCFAVSQTPDPTGAYWTYQFNLSQLPDYFKVGVWPNAYYIGANESTYTAYALNRAQMLVGGPANGVVFTGQNNFLMPADLDGTTLPPAGSPGFFYTFKDSATHGGAADRIEVFALNPNFATPASSTLTLAASINVTPFAYTVCGFFQLSCVPQLGTTAKLDAVSEWPMFRLAYRNFGTHEAMVGNWTIDDAGDPNAATGRAAIRWFELRRIGAAAWSLYQEGTHAPADGLWRFMGSITQDKDGNIALAYSTSGTTINPSIRYATRLATDPLGTLQAEQTLIAGTGSQTSSHSRWGDYSAMNPDPADDCTFWFTNEYFTANGGQWHTRIGNSRIPECSPDSSTRYDFGGDGNADILWRHASTGRNNIYQMNGKTVLSNTAVTRLSDLNYKVAGVGDFNGDGKADILWRHHGTGYNYLWTMNGAIVANSATINRVSDLNWKVAGLGDFNDDGNADILWRHASTGQNSIYLMNGKTVVSNTAITRLSDLNYTVAGIADFNADGKDDILWRHIGTGYNYLWTMNGTAVANSATINRVSDLNWKVAGAGDFNDDGKADILWRHASTGQNSIYLMNGKTVLSNTAITRLSDLNYKVAGVADFNGDGKADILWRHFGTGYNYLWTMNGTTVANSATINRVSDLSMTIVGFGVSPDYYNWNSHLASPAQTNSAEASLEVAEPGQLAADLQAGESRMEEAADALAEVSAPGTLPEDAVSDDSLPDEMTIILPDAQEPTSVTAARFESQPAPDGRVVLAPLALVGLLALAGWHWRRRAA